FYHRHRTLRDLHSFPTRRSSDLGLGWEDADRHRLADDVAEGLEAVEVFLREAVAGDERLAGRGRIVGRLHAADDDVGRPLALDRSEEHTSELQSRFDLVCRLLLE